MGWQQRSAVRQKAIEKGFRSGFEERISNQLKESKVEYQYETEKIPYIIPETKRSYIPDFILPNGIYIEAKGRLTASDRKKLQFVVKQNPEIDLRIVFTSGKTRISKSSKTTYGQWAEKNNIPWAEKFIPESWLKA